MYEESIELLDSLIQCLRPLLNLIDSSPEKEFQDYRNRIDLALISCLSAKKFLQEKAPQEDSIFARNRIRLHLEKQREIHAILLSHGETIEHINTLFFSGFFFVYAI